MNKSCARQDDLADPPPMAANYSNTFSVQIPADQTSVTNTKRGHTKRGHPLGRVSTGKKVAVPNLFFSSLGLSLCCLRLRFCPALFEPVISSA
jgi:hypothetical protein